MESAIELIGQAWWLGVPAGFIVGVLLGINPLALPMLGTSLVLGSAGEMGSRGAGVRVALAFGAGMTVVYTALGILAGRVDEISQDVFRPYAGIGYTVLGAILVGFAAFLLFGHRRFCEACAKPVRRSPTMVGAFLAGIPGGFVNCPACAGIVLGAAAATATVGNALYGGVVMLALGVGHAASLALLTWWVTKGKLFSLGTNPVLRLASSAILLAVAGYFFWLASIEGLKPMAKLP